MIESKQDLYFYLERDRIVNGWSVSKSFISRIKIFLKPDVIRSFLIVLRKAEYYTNCQSWFWGRWYRFLYHKYSIKLGFTIPLNVFGPGLSIPHIGTIVVSVHSKIGANCRLHACVNIGASGGGKNAPNIGDNVYIGPGAILFGDICIADNVTIGANATVNKSCVQQNVVLAGSPASIVKDDYPSWVEIIKV